ncbi:MAG: YMGG-like glycine zipper-containing protein [Myxococcales bacterium]
MKTIVIAAALALPALAQGTAPAPAAQPASSTAAPAQKSLAQGFGLYAFPAKEQTKEIQDKDEYDCYGWAKQNTGIDPLVAAPPADPAQAQQKSGGAVKGAAKGAAVGAAVGAIAGDAGKGAAIGATAGGVGGRSKQKQQNAAAEEKAAADQKLAAANTKTEFNKAFGACLEGKGYTVK